MEYFINSAINQTWKLYILAAFLTLFLLALLFNNSATIFPIPDVDVNFNNLVSSSDQPTTNTTSTTPAAPPPTVIEIQHDTTTNTTQSPPSDVIQSIFNSTSTSSKEKPSPSPIEAPVSAPVALNVSKGGIGHRGGRKKKCKMYEGRWVYKPEENPRYHVEQCPFLEEKMSCRQNGRPDLDYEGWGWVPNDCNIPLFDGRKMMKRLRGKRVIIVGDSLNRNMWESLACLLYTSISPRRAIVDARGSSYKLFKSKDYNFTLEFYWAPFLVNLELARKSGRKVVVLDKLVPSSGRWRGADVMVFNTGHWWTHTGKIKAWDMFQYEGELVNQMETKLAYDRALTTWAHWIRHNVDPTKTKVFFRSISPEHKSKQWCLNATRPITDESYVQLFPPSLIHVSERKITEMEGLVRYLNITKLSTYRRDAHPSIYRFKNWKTMAKDQYKMIADCSHWCLPGLPDTWNRLLYASLFSDNLSPGDLTHSS